jgi:type I restriction enzyme, S subunit
MSAEAWRELALSDLIEKPFAGFWGTDTRGLAASVPARAIRLADASRGGQLDGERLQIRWLTRREAELAKCSPGDLVLVASGMETGSISATPAKELKEPVVVTNFVRRLRPRSGVEPRWLFHALTHPRVKSVALINSGQTSVRNLSKSFYRNLRIPTPCQNEQRRIAEILDALDQHLAVLDRLIAKHIDSHEGRIGHLLSRVTGNSSPLGDFLSDIPRNGFSPKEVDTWTGVQALGLGCLTLHGFEPLQLKNVPSSDPRNRAALLEDGDLLVSRANTIDLVGLPGRYRDVGGRCIYPDLMIRLKSRANVRVDYLEAVIRSSCVRSQIQACAQGTSGSMVKISGRSVSQLRVVVPGLPEQDRILRVMAEGKMRIQAEQQERSKLRLLRKGLMDDLLMGRVRVPVRHDVGGRGSVREAEP